MLVVSLLFNSCVEASLPKRTSTGRYGDFTFPSASGFTLNDGANSFTNLAQNVYGLKVTNIVNANLPLAVTFTNDLNGNLISDGLRWFEYYFDNQLTAVTISNAWRTEFAYDGLGWRHE